MKSSIRIPKLIGKRVLRFRSLVLCGLGAGLFVTHAAVCAVSWHPLHGLLAGAALLYLALEWVARATRPFRPATRRSEVALERHSFAKAARL